MPRCAGSPGTGSWVQPPPNQRSACAVGEATSASLVRSWRQCEVHCRSGRIAWHRPQLRSADVLTAGACTYLNRGLCNVPAAPQNLLTNRSAHRSKLVFSCGSSRTPQYGGLSAQRSSKKQRTSNASWQECSVQQGGMAAAKPPRGDQIHTLRA